MSRKIDALIAEHVMGWTLEREKDIDCWLNSKGGVEAIPSIDWRPSSIIAHAWEVVEVLRETYDVAIRTNKVWNPDGYMCRINSNNGDGLPLRIYKGKGTSMPMAVCLAALDAKGIDVG